MSAVYTASGASYEEGYARCSWKDAVVCISAESQEETVRDDRDARNNDSIAQTATHSPVCIYGMTASRVNSKREPSWLIPTGILVDQGTKGKEAFCIRIRLCDDRYSRRDTSKQVRWSTHLSCSQNGKIHNVKCLRRPLSRSFPRATQQPRDGKPETSKRNEFPERASLLGRCGTSLASVQCQQAEDTHITSSRCSSPKQLFLKH